MTEQESITQQVPARRNRLDVRWMVTQFTLPLSVKQPHTEAGKVRPWLTLIVDLHNLRAIAFFIAAEPSEAGHVSELLLTALNPASHLSAPLVIPTVIYTSFRSHRMTTGLQQLASASDIKLRVRPARETQSSRQLTSFLEAFEKRLETVPRNPSVDLVGLSSPSISTADLYRVLNGS